VFELLQHLGGTGLAHADGFGRAAQRADARHAIEQPQVAQAQAVHAAVEDLVQALPVVGARVGGRGF
jgi:hypothetical protein